MTRLVSRCRTLMEITTVTPWRCFATSFDRAISDVRLSPRESCSCVAKLACQKVRSKEQGRAIRCPFRNRCVEITISFDLSLESVPAFRIFLRRHTPCVRDNWLVSPT
jgi:hypothetical protein